MYNTTVLIDGQTEATLSSSILNLDEEIGNAQEHYRRIDGAWVMSTEEYTWWDEYVKKWEDVYKVILAHPEKKAALEEGYGHSDAEMQLRAILEALRD